MSIVLNYAKNIPYNISGSGTSNYMPKWNSLKGLTSGIIYDNNTYIGISTTNPQYLLDVNGTGNFSQNLLINSIPVSVSGHSHTSSNITNFNSSVSGLIPIQSLIAGTGISISISGTSFTVNATNTGSSGGGSLSNIIEDLSPQLGGNLDLNNYSITGSAFQTTSSGTIIGQSGWIYQKGQNIFSNGSFGIHIGDAQFSNYLLRTTSTDATWNTLLNNGQSGILLASNRTFQFSVNIVARRTDAQDNAAYKLEGLLYNDGYGCAIIGNPIKTVYGESDTSWDARVRIADSGNSNYLFVEGSGANSKTINWLAKVDLLEVGGNISSYTESNVLNISRKLIP